MKEIIEAFSNYARGLLLVILLIGGGLYSIVFSKFSPFRYLKDAISVYGKYLLIIGVLVFSISSLFFYTYNRIKCIPFWVGANRKCYYNYLYALSVILVATTPFATMLKLIDGVFALKTIPTVIATILLILKVLQELKSYKLKIN